MLLHAGFLKLFGPRNLKLFFPPCLPSSPSPSPPSFTLSFLFSFLPPSLLSLLPSFSLFSFLFFYSLFFSFNISWGQNVIVHVLEATVLSIVVEVITFLNRGSLRPESGTN